MFHSINDVKTKKSRDNVKTEERNEGEGSS